MPANASQATQGKSKCPPRQTSRDRRRPAPTQKEVDPERPNQRDPDVSGQHAGGQKGPEDDAGHQPAATTGADRYEQGELSQEQEQWLREDGAPVPSPGPVHCQGQAQDERDTRRV